MSLVVIGSGPGGYIAAVRGAQLGMKVVVVEEDALGGVCLNWGCIPTKALLRTGEVYEGLAHAGSMGLQVERKGYDTGAVIERSRKVAKRLSGGVAYLMQKNKIEVVKGRGKLVKGGVEVGGKVLQAKNVIVATGARAKQLPGFEGLWTYKEAMVPKEMPRSLVVIGAGAIGAEFASFYAAMGVKVSLVEMAPQILPLEDAEIAAIAAKRFATRGIDIHVASGVKKVQKGKDGVKVELEGAVLEAEQVIVAVGIEGNVEGIGLEEMGVKVEKGHIVVDGWGQTSVKGVYAIGDVAGAPWLAHKASHEGVVAVEHMAGVKGVLPLDTGNIPACTYCDPQVASVGLTEAQAVEGGKKVKVGRYPYKANGKALAMGEEEGLVKLVFDEANGALLGAHMVGSEVTEMISTLVLARTLEATEAELMHTVFPHPTLSETMHEATLDAWGRALNI